MGTGSQLGSTRGAWQFPRPSNQGMASPIPHRDRKDELGSRGERGRPLCRSLRVNPHSAHRQSPVSGLAHTHPLLMPSAILTTHLES